MGESRRRGAAADLVLVAAIAVVLFGVFLFPFALTGYPVPVGPDLPVYLWWARVGAAEGLSSVGSRPGTPALLPTLGAALALGPIPAVAGLQYAMGPAIGLAGAALLRVERRGGPAAWALGGFLSGVWAVHLGGGYVANLVFVACLLAAVAAVAIGTRRGTVVAALALGGGGLAHPQFFVVGVAIVAAAAAWTWSLDRRGATTGPGGAAGAVAALAGAGAIVGAGLLATLAGPAPLGGDTSKDAFLRRTGRGATLRDLYLERFASDPGRYAPLVSAPLAVLGAARPGGFVRRFLVAWLVLTAVAIPLGALTSWYPPDRILTFAFCVPLLGAIGVAWIAERLSPRWLGVVAGVALAAGLAWPHLDAWRDERGFIGPEELAAATLAGRIAATTEPGTTLVYVVDVAEGDGLFELTHALNLARATVPPDRARDVRVYLGEPSRLLDGRPTVRGDELYDLASATSLEEIPAGSPSVVFVLRDLVRDPGAWDDPRLVRWGDGLASTAADPRPLPAVEGEVRASSPEAMAGAAVAAFALLALVGYGWARWAFDRAATAAAAAPGVGAAALVLVALVAERVGVSLGDPLAATAISAVAGGSGYALLIVRAMPAGGREHGVLEGQPEIDAGAEVP